MSLVDLLIVLLAIGSLFRGYELGFIRQLFSTAGFLGGLLLGALLAPHVAGLAHTPLSRALITLAATLGPAFVALIGSELVGAILKRRLVLERIMNRVDNALGSLIAAATLLVTVWLGAALLISLPYDSLQTNIRGSTIITLLNRQLPPAPRIIAGIGHFIAPNGFPDVFIGTEPSLKPATLPTPAQLINAVNRDRASVVKVEGQGCGGIVEGSGFVAASGLVATNAHVVAGIHSPYVIDGNGTHPATPVWFDPDLDLAVLRAGDLIGGPLTFNPHAIGAGEQGGVLGYPGGGPFTAGTAAVTSEFTAVGRNIYDQGNVRRDVYAITATVVPGNSGGPLVDLDGEVIGIVFAASTAQNNAGYALSAPQIVRELAQAKAANTPVSTGSCTP